MGDLVSVVIPLFNGQRTILKCLDSLKSQTYKNIEVLIVNDGSTDRSEELVENYIQNHKLLGWHLYSVSNSGASKARNFGISVAMGTYLCFVDADDYVESGYIGRMVSAIQESKSDLCITGYKKVSYKNGKEESTEDCVIPDHLYHSITSLDSDEKLFINGFMHPCWGKLYKTKLIKDNQIIFPDQPLSEDTIFNLEYLRSVRSIKTINYPSYYYIVNIDSNSLSKSFPVNIFALYIKIHKNYVAFFEDYNLDIAIVERMMYAQYYSAVNKTLFNTKLSYREKKKILDSALCNKEVRDAFQRTQTNKTVTIINRLVLRGAYRTAKLVLQISALKEKIKE